jgi:RimJ/RimL family protein N-acetyltransferase
MLQRLPRYDAFWAAFFGIEPDRLHAPGVTVVTHAGLGDYRGVWFFVRLSRCIVSAPAHWVAHLSIRMPLIATDRLPDTAVLRDLFGVDPVRVIGPAYQGSLMPEAFRPLRDDNVRRLRASDDPAMNELRAACSEQEWQDGALSAAGEIRFGRFEGARLVAVAGLRDWPPDATGPCVVSHPGHRGRGHAAAVVSAVVSHALGAGKIMLYQTLLDNAASVAVATRLGFEQYASHIAVRLPEF